MCGRPVDDRGSARPGQSTEQSWPSPTPSGPSTAPFPPLPPLPDFSSLESWYAPPLPPPPPPPSGPPVALPPPGVPAKVLGELGPVPPMPGWAPSGWAPSGRLRRSLRRLTPLIAAAALAVAVGVVGVVVLRGHQARNVASGGAPTPAATRSGGSKASPRHAAAGLSALLSQSVTDRGAVINAVVDVRHCGASLRKDAWIFARAASSRERLLFRLGNLPGRSVLSAAMLRDLAGSWQASGQADSDLARWANGKIAGRCHGAGSNVSLQASYTPDGQATADKKAFACLWDPVARRYGLTAYRWDQL